MFPCYTVCTTTPCTNLRSGSAGAGPNPVLAWPVAIPYRWQHVSQAQLDLARPWAIHWNQLAGRHLRLRLKWINGCVMASKWLRRRINQNTAQHITSPRAIVFRSSYIVLQIEVKVFHSISAPFLLCMTESLASCSRGRRRRRSHQRHGT